MAEPGAPPSMAAPLVALKTSSWQSFIGWVHGAIRSLASGLQAEQTQRESDVQELRADARNMLERIHRLEARDSVPSATAEQAPDLAEEVRRLESKLASWRDQSALKQGTEEDLLRLRLDALESDARARLQPQDLEAERQALQELRKQCESALHEEGRAQHAALQSKLAESAEQLRGLLQAHSSAFEERLRMCESRLLAPTFVMPVQTPPKAASEVSEPKEEPRRPGSTGSGAGAAGGASLESRVARLERNIKAVLGAAPSDGRRLEEVAAHAARAQQEVLRLYQRSQAMESRLSALDGLAASMAAGGDAASAAAVEALERRLEQHVDDKLTPLREQLSMVQGPEKITAEENMDRCILEEVHQDLLFGSPTSKSTGRAEAPDPLSLINAAIASRTTEEATSAASTSLTRGRTLSEVSALQTKLQALAAQQDDRALRLEQEMKLLQQKFFEQAAAQAGGSGGSGSEAAPMLAATLSHHDQELKNLAASVQGLQAALSSQSRELGVSQASAPASMSSGIADADVKALQARLEALQRQVEAQASTSTPSQPVVAAASGSPTLAEVTSDQSLQASTATAALEARAGEALKRVAEAEKRIHKLADEVAALSAGSHGDPQARLATEAIASDQAALEEAKKDLLEALSPADAQETVGETAADSARQQASDTNNTGDGGEQPNSREAARRGLDALLERLGGLEAKVSSHAESLHRLRERLEGSESKAAGQEAALRDLSALLARQETLSQPSAATAQEALPPKDASLATEEVSQSEQEVAAAQQDTALLAEAPRELQPVAPVATTEAPPVASQEGMARLLALEDKVASLAAAGDLHEEVRRLAASVGNLEAAQRPQSEDAAQVFATSVEESPETTPVYPFASPESSHVMQALRDEVAGLAEAFEAQRRRLDTALGSEESSEEGALHKEVRQLAEALKSLQAQQGSETEAEAIAEVKRLSGAMEQLQHQVEAGMQLQQEVERVSNSLAELRGKVDDQSMQEEVRRLGNVVASLERPKSGGLRQEVSKFAESLENLRFRQDDFLVQLKAAKAALQELPALKEELRASREATDSLAQSHAKTKEVTATELHQLTHRLSQLEEKRLKQLVMDVQALQGALVHVQTELQKEVVIPDHILRDIDAKSEARQEAMWAELHKHAETAARRADQLERSLSSRLLSLEHSTNALLQNEAHAREMEREMAKQSEWFAWRIAWLEWAATGEKRSFARPMLPPPATPAATCFKQPMTEDSELWAQEKTGRQRLRRAPLFNLPSAGPANAQRLGDSSPSARTLGASSSAPDLVVGPGSAGTAQGGGDKSVRLPHV